MSLTIAQLRASKTTDAIDEALANLILPVGMSMESFIIQLMDTYLTAQGIYNQNKPTGEKLNFVATPQITNPRIGLNASQYAVDKSYVLRARINTTLQTVEAAMQ